MMDTPDYFLVFIKSSLHFNFAVLVSSRDDIASLKRKAEAQHQDLFPDTGRILARAIKIIQKGAEYTVVDSSPVISFVDRPKGICSFLMDAVVLPPIPPQTHALICGPGDPSSGRYLIEGVNSSCTLQSLKRKYAEDNTNKYSILEDEKTIRVDDLAQCDRDKGNKKKSKEPSSDEVLTCSEGVSSNKGDQIRECSAASENEIVGVPLKSGSSPAGSPGDAYSDRYLIEGGHNPYCTSDSFQKKFLEDNANKDWAVEEDATLEDNSSNDRAAEEDVTLEDNAYKDRAVEEDATLEDNSNKDRAAKEDVTSEDNANKDRAVEEDATLDKGSQKKSKDASSDELLTGNERGVGIREIQFSSENEASWTHLKSFTSLAGQPSEDMPLSNAHSLGHLAEKLACTAYDKGKAKFLPSVSSSSCSGSSSPNYNRAETHKAWRHGMTIHEACTSRLHSRAIRVENLGGEESNGLCREKYMTMEEPGFTSEDLEEEFARINQIESDEILARSLQDEFNLEHQTLDESDEEVDCFMEQFLSQECYLQIPECRRAQMRFKGPAMDHENLLISQLLHEYQKPEVDNPKREELMDELIATNESRADTEVYDGFDFYQDLFYDEDESVQMPNQTEGATESQINHLPVSEIQDDNEDACIICLETPSIGSVMRHLPCFHKFHKECVDEWLLIRNSCPVCKLAIG